jgi:valine--pyruvate aminotransferase
LEIENIISYFYNLPNRVIGKLEECEFFVRKNRAFNEVELRLKARYLISGYNMSKSVHLSKVGEKMNRLTGVREIMKDIMTALKADPSAKWINLSPGNPVILPEVQNMWKEYTKELMESDKFGEVIGRYGMTQGYEPFVDAVVEAYNKNYNWNIKRENVLITAGSQSLYFYCANAFTGLDSSGALRKLLVPLCPDYTGYDGIVLQEENIISQIPNIDFPEKRRFKYKIDFEKLNVDEGIGAMICSRPCNPTGNILTDDEVKTLSKLAGENNIPLIIDAAYAPPYPNLAFSKMTPLYDENVIHCVTLSKAGLAGERVGIAIGHERFISVLEPFESNAGIHSSRFGQALAAMALKSGKLQDLSEKVIKPFYQKKVALFQEVMDKGMPSINWYLHKGEGSLFAWLWIDEEWMNDLKLYRALKQKGLLIVPGSTFFPGLKTDWKHKNQCIRISMTAEDADIIKGAEIIASVLSSPDSLV